MPEHRILDSPRIEVRAVRRGRWAWYVGTWVRTSTGQLDDPLIARGRSFTRRGGLFAARWALRRDERKDARYQRRAARNVVLDGKATQP